VYHHHEGKDEDPDEPEPEQVEHPPRPCSHPFGYLEASHFFFLSACSSAAMKKSAAGP